MDTDEVTVGQPRELVVSKGLSPPTTGNFSDYDSSTGPCTYAGPNDASHDAYPVNCIPWGTARDACRLLGKRLPTEAEWEDHLPVGWRHRYLRPRRGPGRSVAGALTAPTQCLFPASGSVAPGPGPGGSALDVTDLGVRNLGGNVAEWMADFFEPYTAPCWNRGRWLKDPDCADGTMDLRSIRGGNWTDVAAEAATYLRDAARPGDSDASVGFRCVK